MKLHNLSALFVSLIIIFPLYAENNGLLTDSEKIKKIQSLYDVIKHRNPSIPDITLETALKLRKKSKIIWVDVRKKEEREVSGIPGALSRREFEDIMDSHKKSIIISYCTIGSRSAKYTQKLQKKGFRAFNLIGGILSWTFSEEGLVDSKGPTTKVHVYGKKWNLAANGYKTSW